jgi:RNA polymerase sigma-70 factor (ECF subfamily)
VALLGPRIWALCRRLDPEPEDAYQAAWAHLFARLDRFDPDGPASLLTWTTTVVHRHLVDRHRRRSVRPLTPVSPLDDVLDESDDIETTVSRALEQRRLHTALTTLPETWRRILVLHHIHGRSLDDIADDEGIAVGTCKSRLFRARQRLAEVLAARPPSPLRKAR